MDVTSQSSSDPQRNIITCDSTPTYSPPLRANKEWMAVEGTDGGAVQPQGFAKVSVERVCSNGGSHGLECVTSSNSSSSSSSLNDDGRSEGGVSGEGGESGEGEVEEFYSLLDSTLRDGCAVGDDVEEAGAAEGGEGKAALQPGRLQERIAALRRLP